MKYTILIIFLFSASFRIVDSEIYKQKFECSISTDKTIYKVGELPKIGVQIINKTKKEVYMIGALDGSDLKWRMPYCYFTIEKPIPDTVSLLRCGNTDPLSLKHFKLVKSNETFNPYEFTENFHFFEDYALHHIESFRNPGTYKIQFHYSTNSDDIHKFDGRTGQLFNNPDSTQIVELFKSIPRIDIVSNVIEIKFEY